MIRFKNDPEKTMEILSNTYGCTMCGIQISYEITHSRYCLNCRIKYGLKYLEERRKKIIREYEKKVRRNV